MKADFLIPMEQHYIEVQDEETLEQKESKRKVKETLQRIRDIKIKGWKQGYIITAKPVFDAESLKHFEAKEFEPHDNVPRVKMSQLEKLELK